MGISVLIPVLNYEKNLENTVRGIKSSMRSAEIIIICDVTKPEIKKIVLMQEKRLKRMGARTVLRFKERGFGSALRLGFSKARGNYIAVMMGDACDDPLTLKEMEKKMGEGYDIVGGSRFMKGGGISGSSKGFLSVLVSTLINAFSKVKIRDITNAFKMYRKSMLDNIETSSNSFDITTEIVMKAARKGYRIGEVPTVWTNRDIGKTTFSISKEAVKYFRIFLYASITMPSMLTKILFAFTLSAIIYAIVVLF